MFTREELFNTFKKIFKDISLDKLVSMLITEPNAIESFYKLTLGINDGKMISLLFNPHRLLTPTKRSSISIYDSLNKYNFLQGFVRYFLYSMERGDANPLYRTLERGFNGVQYVNEFPPYVARKIIERYYKDKTSIFKVLDPCAGWGGRVIGAASLKKVVYTGCEPCTAIFKGLINLAEWLKGLNNDFDYNLIHSPFEDVNLKLGFYDMALTSPPYFDTEHYSDEETNSFNRFNTFESWVDGFYKILILNTMQYLKPSAPFIINIGNRLYPLGKELFKICDNNNLYVEEINSYLSGYGEGKERFYQISKEKVGGTPNKLF